MDFESKQTERDEAFKEFEDAKAAADEAAQSIPLILPSREQASDVTDNDLYDMMRHAGFDIIPSANRIDDLPKTFKQGENPLRADLNERAQAKFDLIRGFAASPTLIDDMKSHDVRQAWRRRAQHELEGRYGEDVSKRFDQLIHWNNVSQNGATNIDNSLYYLAKVGLTLPETEVNALKVAVNDLKDAQTGGEWHSMSKESRIKLGQDAAAKAVDFLNKFGAPGWIIVEP